MNVLVTGGAGYIGSHTCVELLQSNHNVVVVDNLCNSKREALSRVEKITGRRLAFVQADIRDRNALDAVFSRHPTDAVLHFAGLKAVGESVAQPSRYFENNVLGTKNLIEAMGDHHVKKLVFSSSALVYGSEYAPPLTEDLLPNPGNPYAENKAEIESMLQDLSGADAEWRIRILRYFNPVGAHPSGLIGEDPQGKPNNIMPNITQAAVGRLSFVEVFGNDYPTHDGTGIRDYIHITDLAKGHLSALQRLSKGANVLICNLGTGRGFSVLELISTFEKAASRRIPYQFGPRRPGDVPVLFASCTRAEKALVWRAEKSLFDMCKDSWHWQNMNPGGY